MWPLAGLIQKVINNVQTLLNRLSTTRASNLDKLPNIESDTSTLTSRLTASRASNLSYIRPSYIKRIQIARPSIQSNDLAEVEELDYPVNRDKSILIDLGGMAKDDITLGQISYTVDWPSSDSTQTEVVLFREETGRTVFATVMVVEFY